MAFIAYRVQIIVDARFGAVYARSGRATECYR
jgi:hypothetical protein